MLHPFYGTKDFTFALAHHCAMKFPNSVQLACLLINLPLASWRGTIFIRTILYKHLCWAG